MILIAFEILEIVPLIFIFALKIHFYVKVKTKETSNDLDLNKYYQGRDTEHSKDLSHHLSTLSNTYASDTVTFKPFYYSILESS